MKFLINFFLYLKYIIVIKNVTIIYKMNFNLVSNETDNGHEYNVRLANPITIPANSSIYMNFAEMTRDSKIRLTQKGKVTLKMDY